MWFSQSLVALHIRQGNPACTSTIHLPGSSLQTVVVQPLAFRCPFGAESSSTPLQGYWVGWAAPSTNSGDCTKSTRTTCWMVPMLAETFSDFPAISTPFVVLVLSTVCDFSIGRCTCVQVYRCTGAQVYRCTGVQVHKCTCVLTVAVTRRMSTQISSAQIKALLHTHQNMFKLSEPRAPYCT